MFSFHLASATRQSSSLDVPEPRLWPSFQHPPSIDFQTAGTWLALANERPRREARRSLRGDGHPK